MIPSTCLLVCKVLSDHLFFKFNRLRLTVVGCSSFLSAASRTLLQPPTRNSVYEELNSVSQLFLKSTYNIGMPIHQNVCYLSLMSIKVWNCSSKNISLHEILQR